ncbi:hypothetical protein ABW20_dc0103138 [Dactylellina cionopaga]|nr:hypothetical protein ABW20_dc0103138 [Dactylellina cionopaga]
MKLTTTILLVVASIANMGGVSAQVAASPSCNRDNCLRGLLGANSASALADCTAYLRTTLIVYTSTVTTISTPAPTLKMRKRDLTATATLSAWPTYAACSSTVGVDDGSGVRTRISGVQRFSSACSCIGVQVSATTTIQAVQTVSVVPFVLHLTCLNLDSYYIIENNGHLQTHDFNNQPYPAAIFTFDSSNNLLCNGVKVRVPSNQDPSLLYIDGTAGDQVSCFFGSGGPFFLPSQNCVAGNKRNFQLNGSGPGTWGLYLTAGETNCVIKAHLIN